MTIQYLFFKFNQNILCKKYSPKVHICRVRFCAYTSTIWCISADITRLKSHISPPLKITLRFLHNNTTIENKTYLNSLFTKSVQTKVYHTPVHNWLKKNEARHRMLQLQYQVHLNGPAKLVLKHSAPSRISQTGHINNLPWGLRFSLSAFESIDRNTTVP